MHLLALLDLSPINHAIRSCTVINLCYVINYRTCLYIIFLFYSHVQSLFMCFALLFYGIAWFFFSICQHCFFVVLSLQYEQEMRNIHSSTDYLPSGMSSLELFSTLVLTIMVLEGALEVVAILFIIQLPSPPLRLFLEPRSMRC